MIFRCHIETVMHKKIARKLRDIRNDTIWVNGSDICLAFKPMKMGLRIAHLLEPWSTFEAKYQRVRQTFSELYRIEIPEEEIKADLELLRQLQSKLKEHSLVTETVSLLN